MGEKLLFTLGVIGAVILTYVIMLALQPATNTIIATVNSTGSWAGYESSQGIINSMPLWQWALPGFVGLVAIVVAWRNP